MIGLEFEFVESHNNLLINIFENIDLKLYNFYFEQQEIIRKNLNNKLPAYMSGNLFKQEITSNNIQKIVEINLRMYQNDKSDEQIDTYKDFLASNCELILLIWDARYVEIYIKDKQLQKQILENIEVNKIDYKIKTLQNDDRYEMYV